MERYGILASKDEDQPWKYSHRRGIGLYSNGVVGGFSWPPRSYCCSFCKREFRSAQALGGHMNVHRRERARLRQYSPPWETPSPNPKSNNNINRSKTLIPNLNLAPMSPLPPSSPSYSPATATKCTTKDQVDFSLFGHHYTLLKSRVPREETMTRDSIIEEQNTTKLELAMGCCRAHLDNSLDLELKLGFS